MQLVRSKEDRLAKLITNRDGRRAPSASDDGAKSGVRGNGGASVGQRQYKSRGRPSGDAMGKLQHWALPRPCQLL